MCRSGRGPSLCRKAAPRGRLPGRRPGDGSRRVADGPSYFLPHHVALAQRHGPRARTKGHADVAHAPMPRVAFDVRGAVPASRRRSRAVRVRVSSVGTMVSPAVRRRKNQPERASSRRVFGRRPSYARRLGSRYLNVAVDPAGAGAAMGGSGAASDAVRSLALWRLSSAFVARGRWRAGLGGAVASTRRRGALQRLVRWLFLLGRAWAAAWMKRIELGILAIK